VSVGGLAVTIAESCIQGNIGADIDLILIDNNFLKTFYSEPQSQIVFSSRPKDFKEIELICSEAGIPFERIGKVKRKNIRINSFVNIELEEIKNIYNSSIEKIMAY
jgi:phosphoribosylformylglycinamidine synthase